MKCLNPFCTKKGTECKSQRGLNRHLYNNEDCLIYYTTKLHNDNENTIEQFKANSIINNIFGNTEFNQATKRLCTETRYNNDNNFFTKTTF